MKLEQHQSFCECIIFRSYSNQLKKYIVLRAFYPISNPSWNARTSKITIIISASILLIILSTQDATTLHNCQYCPLFTMTINSANFSQSSDVSSTTSSNNLKWMIYPYFLATIKYVHSMYCAIHSYPQLNLKHLCCHY